MTVEDYAWDYIDNQIEIYESDEFGGGFKIIDKEITKLEKLSSFDNILEKEVELWFLDFRLKPENPEDLVFAGGLEIVDGWLVDYGITGQPHLTFTYEDDNLVYLGNANAIEFTLDTFVSQEIAIRIMLEDMDMLPNETYEGNHIVIKFPLSTGESSQLFLSQPVNQGAHGIWVVERWMDGNGNIYRNIPDFEEDIRIQDYYNDLQEEVDNGHKPWMIEATEVAYDYIFNILGQTLVKRADLEVINPAGVEDFLETPESHYIGYITMMTKEKDLFHLDTVEFLTQEDEERAAELDLDVNYDMPSGFYIYNPEEYPLAFEVFDGTEYLLLKTDEFGVSSDHKSVTKDDFVEYNDSLSYNPLYHVDTKDGYVIRLKEQYIP